MQQREWCCETVRARMGASFWESYHSHARIRSHTRWSPHTSHRCKKWYSRKDEGANPSQQLDQRLVSGTTHEKPQEPWCPNTVNCRFHDVPTRSKRCHYWQHSYRSQILYSQTVQSTAPNSTMLQMPGIRTQSWVLYKENHLWMVCTRTWNKVMY